MILIHLNDQEIALEDSEQKIFKPQESKKQINNENTKYKVFTNQFDQRILEANELITDEEISKLPEILMFNYLAGGSDLL